MGTRGDGRPAAVYLHTNVGLTNGLAHLAAAQLAAARSWSSMV